MINYDFTDRVAIVTGAGGGVGEEISRMILESGGAVIMLDVKPEPHDLSGDSTNRLYGQGDLIDEEFVTDLINEGAERLGRIDYLVNAAGVLWFSKDESLLEMDLDV